ncbi:MAG: glycoside hydrolase family 30 protein [Oscillospiraceae bacterium]
MKIYETLYIDETPKFNEQTVTCIPDDDKCENEVLNIYADEKFQHMIGFGGAITEAAGYAYAKMPKNMQNEMLNAYFGKDGLQYNLGRCSIDSCDFALGNYSAVTDKTDTSLTSFSLARDEEYICPLIEDAMKLVPDLKLLLSPWSPPAYMKTNQEKNHGGELISEYKEQWAKYMCKYIKEYKQKGYNIFAVTVQNEPNAVQKWDSCVYNAAQEKDFVKNYLGPQMQKENLDDVALTIWDHNKERVFDRADYILKDAQAAKYVKAVGFHWYSGNHFDALNLLGNKYPDMPMFFTEGCVHHYKSFLKNQLKHAQRYAFEMIGNLNAGMNAFLDWNIYLEKNGGPNHVKNFCNAPIMADTEHGTLLYHLSYYYIAHFSKYIQPNAVRLGTTKYTDSLHFTAFENPNGQIVGIVLNTSLKKQTCNLRINGRVFSFAPQKSSISTIVLEQGQDF